MITKPCLPLLFAAFLLSASVVFAQQQDVSFTLSGHFLAGKKILKIKRDFIDPYLWVLAQNDEVYRINTQNQAIDDYTSKFAAYHNFQFIDIAGRGKDTVFIATNSPNILIYSAGSISVLGKAGGVPDTVNSIGVYYRLSSIEQPTLVIGSNKGGIAYYRILTREMVLANPDTTGYGRIYVASYRRFMYADSSLYTYPYRRALLPKSEIDFMPFLASSYYGNYFSFLLESGIFGYNIHTAYLTTENIYQDPGYSYLTDFYWGNNNGLWQNRDLEIIDTLSSLYYKHFLAGIRVNKITSILGLTAFGNGHQYGNAGDIKENLLVGTDSGLYFSSSTYAHYDSVATMNLYSLFHEDDLGKRRVNDIAVSASSVNEPICENAVYVACDDGLYRLTPDYVKYFTLTNIAAVSFKGKPDTLSSIALCEGSSVTALVNDTLYTGRNYQWYRNGKLLANEVSDTLKIDSAGDYYAYLYDPCSGIKVSSNHLHVSIISSPAFTFNFPDKLQYCAGTPLTLTAAGKSSYRYRWYSNDTLNNDTSASLKIIQSGKYKVEVSACPGSWEGSKQVQVNLVQLPVPVITTDKAGYCLGDVAQLSVSTPPDPAYSINWYRNDTLLINNANSQTLRTSNPSDYTVKLTSNSPNTDGSVCSQTSAAISINFNPPPKVSIEKIVKTTLCDGQTVELKADYTNGSVAWSTGETTDRISVAKSGAYTATVTSPAGCIADTTVNVQFFPNPVLNLPDTSLCVFTKQMITLTAPPGFVAYSWNNGVSKGQTYTASVPETVTLTVTDTNGCQATQEIVIADQCPDVHIPNAFTPNGDGVNDTWNIAGLENDESTLVRVYSRYGQLVYQSRGYGIAWNGEENGKKLPAGVYYYIITAKNNKQKFSGSLTIIY